MNAEHETQGVAAMSFCIREGKGKAVPVLD